MNRKEYISELRKEIRNANNKMSALQKWGHANRSNAYRYVSSNLPNRDILTSVNSKGVLGFTNKLSKLSDSELKQLSKAVKAYNSASTSSKAGTNKVYKKAYASYVKSQETGKALSYDKWSDIMEHSQWEDFKQKFGSSQLSEIVKKYNSETALYIVSKSLDYNSIIEIDNEAKTYNKYLKYQHDGGNLSYGEYKNELEKGKAK